MTKDTDHNNAASGSGAAGRRRARRQRPGRPVDFGIGEEDVPHLWKPNTLASYCLAKWEALVFDALLVVAGVEFCDKVKRRPKLGWGRRFELRVPVSDPDRWKSPEVHYALIDAVQFLTGDVWDIAFVKRRKVLETPQETSSCP